MPKKNILPLLLAAVAVVAVFSFIVVSNKTPQQQNQTNLNQGKEVDNSDWLTHRNEEYGFEVNYPVDWKRRTAKPGGEVTYEKGFLFKVSFANKKFVDPAFISVSVFDSSYQGRRYMESNKKTVKETIQISGVDGYKYTYRATDLDSKYHGMVIFHDIEISVELLKNNKIYYIRYYADYDNTSYEAIFEQMLESFSFL